MALAEPKGILSVYLLKININQISSRLRSISNHIYGTPLVYMHLKFISLNYNRSNIYLIKFV